MGYEKIVTLAERCAKYVQACGKRSILETKPVGKVDVSKLGVCLSDGTVRFPYLNMIRYQTAEEATAHAKKFVMKPFKLPVEMQKEINADVIGRDLYMGSLGTRYNCVGTNIVKDLGEIDSFHIHPTETTINTSTPISEGDITSLIMGHKQFGINSNTVFNRFGEYNTVRIADWNKVLDVVRGTSREGDVLKANRIIGDALEKEIRIIFMGKDGKRLLQLRNMKEQHKLTSRLEKELTRLENKFENCDYEEMVVHNGVECFKYPNKLSEARHKAMKKVLPQYGIEYETNFSNLLKYDA